MTSFAPLGPCVPIAERALLAAAQRDDQRAQTELLRRYDPLVHATLRPMRLPQRVDRDDIVQEARIGLLCAMRAWRPGRAAFPAFAARCIRNRVIMVLNNAGRQKHRILNGAYSLDAPIQHIVGGRRIDASGLASCHELPGAGPDPETIVLVREQLAGVLAALSTLTPRENQALVGMLNGRSQQQLADEHGGTAKAYATALRRARDKLAASDARVT
jgi:RNA polymerase sigma factor (sigma-70 family)